MAHRRGPPAQRGMAPAGRAGAVMGRWPCPSAAAVGARRGSQGRRVAQGRGAGCAWMPRARSVSARHGWLACARGGCRAASDVVVVVVDFFDLLFFVIFV